MNSNLSKFSYDLGNHMVTAVTEQSINNTVKEYLAKHSDTYTVYVLCTTKTTSTGRDKIYFKVSKNTNVERDLPKEFDDKLRVNSLFSDLEAMQVFNHIDNLESEESKATFERMYVDYYVDSCFKFTTGIPDVFMDDKRKLQDFNPVRLKESIEPTKCEAEYTQVFREIVIVEIYEQRRELLVSVKRQSKDADKDVWKIKYLSFLNARRTEFDNLPDEYKNALRNNFGHISDNQIASLFDISKLIIDLSALSCVNHPTIQGVSDETELNVIASMNDFVTTYLADVFATGYVVTAKPTNLQNYLFKPTQYAYSVSKNGTGEAEFRTLNYILSTDSNYPIDPQYYDWDWMAANEINEKSGVTVISRDLFFGKFNNEFKEKVISMLRKRFIAVMKGNGKTIFDMEYTYKIEQNNDADNGNFVFDKSKNVYNYSPKYEYHSKSDFISVYVPPIFAATGQLELKYSFDCQSKWGSVTKDGIVYPAIIFSTQIALYADIEYDSGHSTGNIYNHTLEMSLGIAVNSRGGIEFVKDIKDTDNGASIDINGWSKFASFGGIKLFIDDIYKEVQKGVNEVVISFNDSFMDSFACVSNWVLVGDKTFTFSDEDFSSNGDFYSDIKYVSPL